MTATEKFRRLLDHDLRYDAEAYNFIYEALDFTLKSVVKRKNRSNQHVSGDELLEGLRLYSIEKFGCLAHTVLKSWGLHATEDVGEIVFNLVEHDLMGKQESDNREDFKDVYDFDEVFDVTPVFRYSKDSEEWQATYVSRAASTSGDSSPLS